MNDGPYTPPRSHVDDPPKAARGPRPRAVKIALALLWIGVAAALATWAKLVLAFGIAAISPSTMGALLQVAIFAALVLLIGRGTGWARYVLLVLTVIDIASAIPSWPIFRAVLDTGDQVLVILKPAAILSGLVLVLLHPARAWFRRPVAGR